MNVAAGRPLPRCSRRDWLAAAATLFVANHAGARAAAPPLWTPFEMAVPADARGARRALVIVPADFADRQNLPLLVLLHGLGETRNEQAGIRAWLEPYGLGNAWKQLATPPLERSTSHYLSDADYDRIERSLANEPFMGFGVVCPFLPNPNAGAHADQRLEHYARWLDEALLPAVRDRFPAVTRSRERTGIAGVSLGGYAALEVALQRPDTYATLGCVQAAFPAKRAASYARDLAARFHGPARRIYIATSMNDPYRTANQTLAQELNVRSMPYDYCLRPGPHSQGWLRDAGAIDLLLWHDRALRAGAELAKGDYSCCAG